MSRRVFSLWAIAMVILMVVAGCGRPAGTSVNSDHSRSVLRLLVVGDPFALALERARADLERMLGVPLSVEIVGYNDNRRLLFQMATDRIADYDLVSFDVVWLGELVMNNILAPLDDTEVPPESALLPGSLASCRYRERFYGIPYQPHTELLWVRSDWFDAEGLEFPRTTDELLAAARRFHKPEDGRYGVAWNAQRGQPLGQSMAHFFAAFGQLLLDERGRPAFNTERGLRAARYALALRDLGPPDVLNMAWDQRVARFASGTVAMTYGWGARAFMAEEDPASAVRGRVRYGPPPHAPDAPPVAPLGVWALGIPANAADPAFSRRALLELTSQKAVAVAMAHGHGAPAWRALMEEPRWRQRYPVFDAMLALMRTHSLSADIRPAVPQWADLCEILGTVFHDMLLEKMSPEEALAEAERRARELFEARP